MTRSTQPLPPFDRPRIHQVTALGRRPRLERLEPRQLLYGGPGPQVTLADIRIEVTESELYVVATGTDQVDEITIHNLRDDVRITIFSPGIIPSRIQETFDIPTLEAIALTNGRQFTGFWLQAGQGNDKIDASLLKYHGDTTLDGGEGDDTILGGHRNDTIRGGEGDDTILMADHLDELSEAGGPGSNDSVTFIPDVVAPGSSAGIWLLSDNIESVVGTNDHDLIDLSDNPLDVTIDGREGDDLLTGGSGDDTLLGGTGDDELFGGSGDDFLAGESGDDTLLGGSGNDTLEGADGIDLLAGEADHDTLRGGSDEDTIRGGSGNDLLEGGAQNDRLEGNQGDDHLDGGSGNDTLLGEEGDDTLEGQQGDDRLVGGTGTDTLDGGSGDDTADYLEYQGSALTVDLEMGTSSAGDTLTLGSIENVDGSLLTDNTLIGDAGNNRLVGGPGDDKLAGRDGSDVLIGGDGADHLRGEGDDDLIDGGVGNDLIEGDGAFPIGTAPFWLATSGDDTLFGGPGDDMIYTNDMVDAIADEANSDRVIAGEGDDTVQGDAGADYIAGEAGNDILWGLAGLDTMHGGSGSDFLTGGAGADILVGGEDQDTLTIDYLLGSQTLADVAVVTSSGPDTLMVVGDTGPLSPTDEVIATLQLDDPSGPFGGIYSDYDPSIDGLYFL